MLHGLKTDRLTFRRLVEEDYIPWMEFFSSPEALKYVFITPGDEKECRHWIQRQLDRYKKDGTGLYALINAEGIMVGQAGLLKQLVDQSTETEISYHLIPKYWGMGYASEAAACCKQFAFNNVIADSLISIIHIDNDRSKRVALRNGMKKEKKTTFKGYPVNIFRVNR